MRGCDAMPLAEAIVGAGWFTFYLASMQVKKTKTIYLARYFILPVARYAGMSTFSTKKLRY
jgi:hypothetical protein